MIEDPASESDSDELGPCGSLLDKAEFLAGPQAIPPQWIACGAWPATLPTSNILSGTPSIAMQGTAQHLGSPGLCEAQSFGYGLGTYTADLANGNAPTESQYQVSAVALCRAVQAGRDLPGGIAALPYLNQLISLGCPDADEVPYQPDCAYLGKINLDLSTYSGVTQFCLGSHAAFQIGTDTMELIKAFGPRARRSPSRG